MFTFYDSDDVVVQVSDSSFYDNLADFGGCINLENPRGTTIIKNCYFLENKADFRPVWKYFGYIYLSDLSGNLGSGGVLGLRGSPKNLLYMEKNVYQSNWAYYRGNICSFLLLS